MKPPTAHPASKNKPVKAPMQGKPPGNDGVNKKMKVPVAVKKNAKDK